MLPWLFAYDHINYARYLPVYLVTMTTLPDTHPEAYHLLADGDFGVRRSTSHGFSQLPVDQTIEQTLNRSTKTKGGIVGFSLRKGAVQRWMLTAHSRAALADKCREMVSMERDQDQVHKEIARTCMQRDEADVKKVMDVVQNWYDPFEPSEELVSLGSGYVADESLKRDLLDAKEKGSKALVSFITDRLLTDNVGLYETLTKLRLGTFRDVQKKASVRARGSNVILRADRNLFARLLVIGQSRQMDLRELLTHELGLFPWSLATSDGSLAKTNKAALSKLVEDGMEDLTSLPPGTTSVIMDAMAMLQMVTRMPDRFADLADMLLTEMLAIAGSATRVDFVADQYPNLSIKEIERSKRGRDGQVVFAISSCHQPCPRQWKKFMSNGTNKTRLMHFLVNEWSTRNYAEKIGTRTLYVTHGSSCTKIKVVEGAIVSSLASQLCSNQEEPDTRMFLHAYHASSCGHTSIAIRSSDTDVEVLACYHQASIPASITLISGTRCRTRLIRVVKHMLTTWSRCLSSATKSTCSHRM